LGLWSGKPLSNLQRRWAELNVIQDDVEREQSEQDRMKTTARLIYLIIHSPNQVAELLFGTGEEVMVSDVYEEELAEILDPFWGGFDESKGIEHA